MVFDKVSHRKLLWKVEHIGRLKGSLKKMDWRLSERKGNENSSKGWKIWMAREVKSGLPQGSVLALIMCLVYVNDITEGVCSYISLFARDVKLLRNIRNHIDCEELHNELSKIYEWKLMGN